MKSSSVIKGGDIIPKCKDLTGQKFKRLLVVSREPSKNGHVSWLCLCDCGNYTTVRGDKLITGHTKSCGCLHKEAIHETHCLSEWCEILGLNLNTVTSRLYKQNWTISEALELKERGCIN